MPRWRNDIASDSEVVAQDEVAAETVGETTGAGIAVVVEAPSAGLADLAVAAVVIALAAWIFRASTALSVVATLLGVLVIVRHISNIQRLLAGTEHRWEKKKSTDSDSELAS